VTVFDDIREGAAWVSGEARFVHLQRERIAPYAAALAAAGLPALEYDATHHVEGSPRDTVAFMVALDTINFGSGYFPHLRKRPGMSGYFTVASSLKDRWEGAGPLSGDELRSMRPDDCAALFGQMGNDGPAQELMALFARAFNDLGIWLGERYDDDPLGAIADANGEASRLVALLAEMPFYRDVASYHGRDIPLYKRAQILASDLAIAFDGEGPGAFRDIGQLTIFADNLVPHVLRVDGLLEYDPELLARIERGELLAAGSAEEVEIRAVTIHAVEELVAALRAAGTPTTAHQLDYLLWNRGLDTIYKELPRHRTRTVYY
jgi:hypothetical protein